MVSSNYPKLLAVTAELAARVMAVLIGKGGNDVLLGEPGNGSLQGGLHNDILDGGTDTASYSSSTTAVAASLATDFATGEGSDLLSFLETLTGSTKGDKLTVADIHTSTTPALNAAGVRAIRESPLHLAPTPSALPDSPAPV
ncbi:MAG TPA: hypothetical protein VJ827_09210 [Rubrobacter sp.]|nr:hypothetical protein [Rubrobacter sp.]